MIEKVLTNFIRKVFSREFLDANANLVDQLLRHHISNLLYGETFLRQLDAVDHHDTTQRLKHISAKTLVIGGDSDILVPRSCLDLLVDQIPSARLCIIPYGTHSVHMEHPDLFNKILIDFLQNSWIQHTVIRI